MPNERFSARFVEGDKHTEFACAHSLLEIGRKIMRAAKNDGRCMVVWDHVEQKDVEPAEMVAVYRKLMR